LVETLAHVEAHIDFPDEDIQTETAAQLAAKCGNVAETLKKLQATAREGKILREGVRVAIVGRPNVGKSSLMNALLGEDRAIVTPVPGTTRDTVEEVVNIRGLPMRLIDTAGLREGADAVEREGVRRSQQAIEAADVIVHVLDGSEILHQQDELIRNQLGGKAVICAVNKSDIAQTLDVSRLVDGKPVVVRTSALTGAGIEALKDALEELVWGGKVGLSQAEVTINSRHEAALMRALEALEKSRDGFLKQRNLEVIAVDLKTALDAVGEITGHTSTADILDKVFSAFCIGK
jgi:tRNA modification GTPase